jgi:hypothetical protein
MCRKSFGRYIVRPVDPTLSPQPGGVYEGLTQDSEQLTDGLARAGESTARVVRGEPLGGGESTASTGSKAEGGALLGTPRVATTRRTEGVGRFERAGWDGGRADVQWYGSGGGGILYSDTPIPIRRGRWRRAGKHRLAIRQSVCSRRREPLVYILWHSYCTLYASHTSRAVP